MPETPSNKDSLADLVNLIVESYRREPGLQHLDSTFLPSRAKTIQTLELLRRIIFPGFFDDQKLTSANIHYHVGELLSRVRTLLYEQIRESLRYDRNRSHGAGAGDACDQCDTEAEAATLAFLQRVPAMRHLLATDMQAGFDGDPAAASLDEIIFCYPGFDAIFIHRVAHELWKLRVPLLPRIMSEYAHNETGIDIHPGATIGESFFIDHGTGVVIGETTTIGDRVKIYQGVTLGALSTKGGQAWRGRKRHPTIEADVTIYPNTTILGGETIVGSRSVINGSVFLIHSVPSDSTVRVKHPEPEIQSRLRAKKGGAINDAGLDI
ncbi:MAG: serine acetyltransferase [Planctomycetes bacterium]|nr:serine acetyltransferase [Planctomycetota bacterium]